MASYLRPRRGKKATAESQNIVLKRGEVFFESPGGGVGTGTGRIKIGDGTTAYTSLPYFLNPDNFISNISTATVTFTETSITNNTTLLNRIVTGAALNIIIASIKNLLSNLNNDITYQEITYENWLNLTQQEKENGNYDVTGVPALIPTASGVTYNNTTSGLSATTVQGAIDELDSSLILHNHREYGYIETSYGNVFVVKDTLNKIVTINGTLLGIPNSAWTKICEGIPVPAINYYSQQSQFFIASDVSASSFVSMHITTNGALFFYGRNSISTTCFSYTYLFI